MMQMHPYILNVNEDAQLSGVVKLFIEEGTFVSPQSLLKDAVQPPLVPCVSGEWVIGLCEASPTSISIKGLG